MDIVKIILTSLLSIAAMFILTKLMGNRQISQLSMFDYINGITIGSIAAELATSLESDFINPLIAMIVYAAVTILITLITTKSLVMRRFFSGRSVILFENGQFRRTDMRRAQVDVSEFMSQCRISGCFSLSELECAILEANGRISFMPKSSARPVQPSDMGITVKRESISATVILDGVILTENLDRTGHGIGWLMSELKEAGCEPKEVMVAEIDKSGKLGIYLSDKRKEKNDIFQ